MELPRATRLSNIIARGYKLLEKMHLSRTVDEARYENGLEGNFFEGYWQGFRFHEGMDVKKELRFRPLQLNERNMELLDESQRSAIATIIKNVAMVVGMVNEARKKEATA